MKTATQMVDEVSTYQYNNGGKIETIEVDNDGDSVSDVRTLFVYDDRRQNRSPRPGSGR